MMLDEKFIDKKVLLQKETIEHILSEVIDDLYNKTKDSLVDYKTKTHRLEHFKEIVKANFHRKLQEDEKFIF